MKCYAFLLAAAALLPAGSEACDCFGNSSYCETLDPSWFVNPSTTALVVKLDDHYYGIHVKVVQAIGGEALPADTLMVWGDNGGLCRLNLNSFAIGDTLVFGLNHCDLWGNEIWNSQYPPDLEHPQDYQVSVCGVYWLDYDNGLVDGPITSAMSQSVDLAEFTQMVMSCSQANALPETAAAEPMLVSYAEGTPRLELIAPKGTVDLSIMDGSGRVVLRRAWNGQRIELPGLMAGSYVAVVNDGTRRWIRKLIVARS